MYFNLFRKEIVLCVCSAILLLTLSACNETKAIYAEIEKEEVIKTSNLSNTITPLGMIRFDDTYYVASGGALFKRLVDGKNWSKESLPSGFDGISKLVSVDENTAYAILLKGYHLEISSTALVKLSFKKPDVTFETIRETPFSKEQISSIFILKGEEKGEHNVYASLLKAPYTGPSSYVYYAEYHEKEPIKMDYLVKENKDVEEAIPADKVNDTITGVTRFKDKIYISTQSQLFRLIPAVESSSYKLEEVPVIYDKKNLTGYIGGIYSNEDVLYLSNHEHLWSIDMDPTDTNSIWKREFYSKRMFTTFQEIDSSNFTGILVGARYLSGGLSISDKGRDAGYYELNNGDITLLRKPSGNKYTSGALHESGVTEFFLDGNSFFVFTISQGLWRGDYEASLNIDWFQE